MLGGWMNMARARSALYILYAQGSVHVEVEDDVMPLRGYAVDFGA